MSLRLNHISSFLVLSLTVHAGVLLMWAKQSANPGSTGHIVHLTMTDYAGEIEKIDTPEQAQTEVSAKTNKATKQLPLDNPANKAQDTPTTISTASEVTTTASINTATQNTLASSNATTAQHENDRHLRDSIMELITQRLTYPVIARKRGWQGIVRLELHIESNGTISSLHVNETSGYAVLDSAAMESLQLASIPDADQWLNGHAIDIVVPVEYRLLDT